MSEVLDRQTAAEKRKAVLDAVRSNLDRLPDQQMAAVEDPSALGNRMAKLVPSPAGVYGQLIGPVYSTAALEALWGISREGVSKKAREGKVLALKVKQANLFPVFQFHGDQVREDVMELVRILRESVDPFTIAQWLCTPSLDDRENRAPLQLLEAGEVGQARTFAIQAAARWAA